MQVHEPVLALGLDVRADIERSVAALAGAGVPLDLVTYYDDLAEDVYAWVTRLPVAALSLDFCGVPGAAHGCATAALIAKHGFPKVRGEVAPRSLARGGTGPASRPPAHTPLPSLSDRLPTHARPAPPRQDKRLGAGIIDGRSIWRDDGTAPGLLAALRQALGPDQAISVQVGGGGGRNDVGGLGRAVEHIRALRPSAVACMASTPDPVASSRPVPLQSSVPLQHVPYDVAAEKELPSELTARLAFALQKLQVR